MSIRKDFPKKAVVKLKKGKEGFHGQVVGYESGYVAVAWPSKVEGHHLPEVLEIVEYECGS